jgi:hypothetical protein
LTVQLKERRGRDGSAITFPNERSEGDDMEEWLDRLASELGDDPLSAEEADRLLAFSREVAHRVERRITPISTFLLGAAVGRGTAGGTDRVEALARALATVEALLPDAPAAEG